MMPAKIRGALAIVLAVMTAAAIDRPAPAGAGDEVTRERLDNGFTVLVRQALNREAPAPTAELVEVAT